MEIVTLNNERGDAVLREKATPVQEINQTIVEFSQRMIEAMIMGHGVGLAAPQVGKSLRMFVCRLEDEDPRIFINPEIIETSLEQSSFEEGCLSVPGVYDELARPASVKIQAWNEKGKPFTLEAEDFLARVIQHEYDHLKGVLFIDHLPEKRRSKILKTYSKRGNSTL